MIRTKPPSDEYRDGWDRIFGDGPEPRKSPDEIEVTVRLWPVAVPVHNDNTGTACRNGGKRVPMSHLDHDACYVCGDALGSARQHQARTSWPTAHESDCPAATGDGSCRCPMGNL